MTAGQNATPAPRDDAIDDGDRVDDRDVLRRLRTDTAAEHQAVEDTLDLLDADLTREHLVEALTRMHGFWLAAEAGLDAWAQEHPADAVEVDWAARRRSHLFAADLAALGAPAAADRPQLPDVADTDEALGRLYVLEGSSLGGVFIDRHLATLPQFADAGRLACFSPYGEQTGARWHDFRTVTRARVAGGGDADRLVAAARETFGTLARWCGAAAPEQAPWTPTSSRGGHTRGNEVVA
ncbi:biliverdin-producing heme oxygenase [Modestobacter lacusdianchii]